MYLNTEHLSTYRLFPPSAEEQAGDAGADEQRDRAGFGDDLAVAQLRDGESVLERVGRTQNDAGKGIVNRGREQLRARVAVYIQRDLADGGGPIQERRRDGR